MTRSSTWALQDAKARFSEVVRKAKSEGPQKITVHGREEVVIVSIEEYRRAKGEPTGAELIAAFRQSPFKEIDLEPSRVRTRVRRVKL